MKIIHMYNHKFILLFKDLFGYDLSDYEAEIKGQNLISLIEQVLNSRERIEIITDKLLIIKEYENEDKNKSGKNC